MNPAIPDDVDTELSRYLDAEEIGKAGINPAVIKQKKVTYNKQRGVNEMFMPLPSGGYTKIGEEKVVDPVPPQDVGKPPPDQVFDQATASWQEPAPVDRTAEIQAFRAEMPRAYEDYLAAGFTEPELQAAGVAAPGAPREQMSPEAVAAAATGTIEPQDLTIREGHTDVLRQIFESVGADQFFARQLAESIVGNPASTRDLGIGLADLTPLGAVYGGQEGYQTFSRGLESGDNVTAALGALEAGLSVLEAIPLTAAGGRAMRQAIPGIRQTIEELGQEAQQRIAREGSTLYSNPVGPVVDRALAVAGRLAGGREAGIRAFHGSPFNFDRFDISKMGTGEGAQAYGPGLYVAESEDVARGYRDALTANVDPRQYWELNGLKISGGGLDLAKRYIDKAGGDIDAAYEAMSEKIRKGVKPWSRGDHEEGLRALELARAGEISPQNAGRMYEVNIAARPEEFIDYDAPLSAQSPNVQRAFGYVPKPTPEEETAAFELAKRESPNNIGGHPALEELYRREAGANAAERNFQRLVTGGGLDADSLPWLLEQGIPGIRYFDASSRGAGEGTRNYVVFDDALIDIVKKYGIAGLMVGAAVQAELGVADQIEGGI